MQRQGRAFLAGLFLCACVCGGGGGGDFVGLIIGGSFALQKWFSFYLGEILRLNIHVIIFNRRK